MVKDFLVESKKTVVTSANANPFKVFKVKKPAEKDRESFHAFVVKALCGIRVKELNLTDVAKLKRLMLHSKIKPHDNSRLTARHVMMTSVNAAFAVHEDFKSHSKVTVFLSERAFHFESSKQKLNTKSFTEAETVVTDIAMTHVS